MMVLIFNVFALVFAQLTASWMASEFIDEVNTYASGSCDACQDCSYCGSAGNSGSAYPRNEIILRIGTALEVMKLRLSSLVQRRSKELASNATAASSSLLCTNGWGRSPWHLARPSTRRRESFPASWFSKHDVSGIDSTDHHRLLRNPLSRKKGFR